MIFTAEQLLPIADAVREHEADHVHLSHGSLPGGVQTLSADLYREDTAHWRVTVDVDEAGTVYTFGPTVPA